MQDCTGSRRHCHLWMPPALQAVLTSSGANVGLAVIYPAFGAVGDRWPWWNPRIGAPSRYRALALVQCLGFGRSRFALFRHHYIITLAIPFAARWLKRQRRPSLGISRRGSAWPR